MGDTDFGILEVSVTSDTQTITLMETPEGYLALTDMDGCYLTVSYHGNDNAGITVIGDQGD